jgi:hypothetical protein
LVHGIAVNSGIAIHVFAAGAENPIEAFDA